MKKRGQPGDRVGLVPTGRFARFLTETAFLELLARWYPQSRFTGIDLSAEAIEYARARTRGRPSHAGHQRYGAMDRRARSGPWTRKTLELIRAQPGVRAADLAAELGRPRDDFKQDVRRLKRLGLTISLEIGYRLSPLGEAFLGR